MSSYWISEDWKVKVETLESYLRRNIKEGVINHAIRVTSGESDDVTLYIHPLNANGETIDYKVTGNSLYPADPAFRKPDHPIIQYSHTGNGRVFQMSSFTEYLSLLERLRQAADKKDQGGMDTILMAMREWDEEMGIEEGAEEELIPLPPELEALPDIQAFAALRSLDASEESRWKPIIGKRIDVNGIIAILHVYEETLWRLTELTSGWGMGTDRDPQNAVDMTRIRLDDAGVALVRRQAKEKRAEMPPNVELDAIIAREVALNVDTTSAD